MRQSSARAGPSIFRGTFGLPSRIPGPNGLEQVLGPAIEVVAKATRRQLTVEYKRKIVREADGCKTPGAIGALLRREGLYSSHLFPAGRPQTIVFIFPKSGFEDYQQLREANAGPHSHRRGPSPSTLCISRASPSERRRGILTLVGAPRS